MIEEIIRQAIGKALASLELENVSFNLEHPEQMAHGDYASNVALILGKKAGRNPKELALELKSYLEAKLPSEIEKIEIACPGFINFYLTDSFFIRSIGEILEKKDDYGKGEREKGMKKLYEYTDPNPMKQFHIGHLMSNAIGESLARLSQWNGATISRMCYGGDVGMHVAKTIWGMLREKSAFPQDHDALSDKVKFVGDAYVLGSALYEDDAEVKKEIEEINKKVFAYLGGNAVDEDIEVAYKKGKAWSIELFHQMYQRLGTSFDYEIFESEVSGLGKLKVEEYKAKGVFVESEGAIVYEGEKKGLHTRVFINSQGLPTYEAKELGLMFKKFALYEWDESVIITASEQKDFYKVILAALSEIDQNKAEKTTHLTHGMMRFADGKMSSRKGNIITAEELISMVREEVGEKIKERGYDEALDEDVREKVAIGALKYLILKQSPGKDIIYDPKSALSFEGDSGPYLQYSYARARSLLQKADEVGVSASITAPEFGGVELEKLLCRFPEVVERAGQMYAPQLLTTYLINLAAAFNAFYASGTIVSHDLGAPWKVALTAGFAQVMNNGLSILAIPVPSKM